MINSAKGADARPETTKGTRSSLRGAFDTATVLREFLNRQSAFFFSHLNENHLQIKGRKGR